MHPYKLLSIVMLFYMAMCVPIGVMTYVVRPHDNMLESRLERALMYGAFWPVGAIALVHTW